jgi:hypothetical protein
LSKHTRKVKRCYSICPKVYDWLDYRAFKNRVSISFMLSEVLRQAMDRDPELMVELTNEEKLESRSPGNRMSNRVAESDDAYYI